MNNILSICLIV